MAKDKQAKAKERERRVAQKKLQEQKQAREAAAPAAEKKSKTASLIGAKFAPQVDSAGNKKDPLVKKRDEL